MGCDLCALTLSTLGHAIGGMSLQVAAKGLACWVAHSLSFADATTLAQSDIICSALSGLMFTARDTAVCSADAAVCGSHDGSVTHAALAGLPSGYTWTAAAPTAARIGSVPQKQDPSVYTGRCGRKSNGTDLSSLSSFPSTDQELYTGCHWSIFWMPSM